MDSALDDEVIDQRLVGKWELWRYAGTGLRWNRKVEYWRGSGG